LDEVSEYLPKFNTTSSSLQVSFNSPVVEQNSGTDLNEYITALTDYQVVDVPGIDLLGLRIRNTEKVQDKLFCISLRRREQLKTDVVLAVLGKVIQNNAKLGLNECLEVHLDHVMMPAGNGKRAEKTKVSNWLEWVLLKRVSLQRRWFSIFWLMQLISIYLVLMSPQITNL